MEALCDDVRASLAANDLRLKIALEKTLPWSLRVMAVGYSLTTAEQHTLRETLKFVPFKGKADLKNPQIEYFLLIDYGGFSKEAQRSKDKTAEKRVPLHFWFGRKVQDDEPTKALLHKFSLKVCVCVRTVKHENLVL
jgi:hypothetical protein